MIRRASKGYNAKKLVAMTPRGDVLLVDEKQILVDKPTATLYILDEDEQAISVSIMIDRNPDHNWAQA